MSEEMTCKFKRRVWGWKELFPHISPLHSDLRDYLLNELLNHDVTTSLEIDVTQAEYDHLVEIATKNQIGEDDLGDTFGELPITRKL